MLIGLVLIVFANVDTLAATTGSEYAAGITIFLWIMGWLFGWFLIEVTTQKDMHMNRWLEGLILFLYMGSFTALWIWSMWASLPARIFNWLVGILLIVIALVSVARRRGEGN
jgi:hypothetical protein